MDSFKRICRHCGNETFHSIIFTYERPDSIYDESGKYIADFTEYLFFTKCETCTNISIFGNWDLDEDWNYSDNYRYLYPEEWDVSENVPDAVRIILMKAIRVKQIEPMAYIMLIRKVLEQICRDQGATKGTLEAKLIHLEKSDLLPPTLFQASDVLRMIGNKVTHEEGDRITPDFIEICDDFIKILIEYLYILPSRLEKIKIHSSDHQWKKT